MAVMETIRAWVNMSQNTILCRWMKKVARACVFHLWYPRSLICHCPPRTVMKPIYRQRPGLDPVEDNKRTYPFDVLMPKSWWSHWYLMFTNGAPSSHDPIQAHFRIKIVNSSEYSIGGRLNIGNEALYCHLKPDNKWQWTKKRVLPNQVENISGKYRAAL